MSLIFVTETLCAEVLGEVLDANEWIKTMSKEDLERWLTLVDKIATDEEACWIAICVAMALYAREINTYDFEADEQLCKQIVAKLTTNLRLESNRRQGKCTISHPLYLYKSEGIVVYA